MSDFGFGGIPGAGGGGSLPDPVTVTHGGTGLSACAIGDVLYGSAADTLSRLTGNTTATKKFLSQTGNGSVSAAPSWAALDAGDIGSGTLPVARGGTGRTDGTLYTGSSVKAADWYNRKLIGTGGTNAAIDWGLHALINSATNDTVMEWSSLVLYGKWRGQVQPVIPTTLTVSGGAVATNVDLGNVFNVTVSADCTLSIPTGTPSDGQRVTWRLNFSGAYTVTLATGSSGAFRYGADVTTLTAGTNGKSDYLTAIWDATDSRWDVVAAIKGF
jgi:hypothetical protein